MFEDCYFNYHIAIHEKLRSVPSKLLSATTNPFDDTLDGFNSFGSPGIDIPISIYVKQIDVGIFV